MWYAIQCLSGREEGQMRLLKKRLSNDALEDVFVFTRSRMKKYCSNWHQEVSLLYPGYIFLESFNEAALTGELKRCKMAETVLADGELLFRISLDEETFLRKLCGRAHHIGMSRGIVDEGKTWITEGPLKGNEQLIKKIDRHKRIAQLKSPDETYFRDIWAGLELLSAESYEGERRKEMC